MNKRILLIGICMMIMLSFVVTAVPTWTLYDDCADDDVATNFKFFDANVYVFDTDVYTQYGKSTGLNKIEAEPNYTGVRLDLSLTKVSNGDTFSIYLLNGTMASKEAVAAGYQLYHVWGAGAGWEIKMRKATVATTIVTCTNWTGDGNGTFPTIEFYIENGNITAEHSLYGRCSNQTSDYFNSTETHNYRFGIGDGSGGTHKTYVEFRNVYTGIVVISILNTLNISTTPYPLNDSLLEFSTSNVNFNISVNSTYEFNCSLYINSTLNQTGNFTSDTHGINWTVIMDEGYYDYFISCFNATGITHNQKNSSTNLFLVDNIPPNVTVIEPSLNTTLNESTINTTFNVTTEEPEANVFFRWFVNGIEYLYGLGESVFNFIFDASYIGDNNVTLIANDTLGNTKVIVWNITVENINATLSIYSPADNTISNQHLNVSFNVSDPGNYNASCDLIVYNSTQEQKSCYQETANVSTACGGKATGSYTDGSSSYHGELEINYTKPTQIGSDSIWQVKIGTLGIVNLSIDSSNCFDSYSDKLHLRLISDSASGGGVDPIYSSAECHNGSEWIQLINDSDVLPGAIPGEDPVSYIYDGNWNTEVSYYDGVWHNGCSGGMVVTRLYEEAMWWSYVYSVNKIVDINNISFINYTFLNDDTYNWSLTCTMINDSISSDVFTYTYDNSAPYFGNDSSDNSNSFFPEIGDTINLNITVYEDIANISTCWLEINDTGSWVNQTEEIINRASPTNVGLNYVIPSTSNSTNNITYWRVWCNDTTGNINYSYVSNFTVRDVTLPNFNFSGSNVVNGSIISKGLYNLSLNVTFYDYNLFQASINITCDINGTVYYWEILDINTSTYTKSVNFALDNLSLQRCEYIVQASDDHTVKEIEEYSNDKISKGIKYTTEKDMYVEIKSLDDDFDKVIDDKLIDRHEFTFKYDDEKEIRTYKIKSNKILYPRSSEYPAHFVAWDDETHTGNWIDFLEEGLTEKEYTIKKISDYEYDITIEAIKPGEVIKEIAFKSIGGTNIENFTGLFYIGGWVNITTNNSVNSSYFNNFSLDVGTISAILEFNGTWNTTSNNFILQNLTNGTYTINFSSNTFFSKDNIVFNVTGGNHSLIYNSSQSQLIVTVSPIKIGGFLDNYTFFYFNQIDVVLHNVTTGINETEAFMNLNAGTYNYTLVKEGYVNATGVFTIDYLENTTLLISMPFNAVFNFKDEDSLGDFNMSSPDIMKFSLTCPGETYWTTLNTSFNASNSFTTLIDCEYKKFKFTLDYGTDEYYRTFILTPDEALAVNIYLIDLATTASIVTTFFIDDLYADYDNPVIYIMKNIGNETIQITANEVDIEGKVTAFLIANHEYIIRVASDNNPIRSMGTYSADSSGSKTIRLYEVSLSKDTMGYYNDVSFGLSLENISSNDTIVAVYEDLGNQTSSVTFNVYVDSQDSIPIHTYTELNVGQGVEALYNILPIYNKSTLIGEIVAQHATAGEISTSRQLQEDNEIEQELIDWLNEDDHYPGLVNWLITLLIGVIAIMATAATANKTALVVIGFAALLIMFGWFSLSWGILGIALLVVIISTLKAGERENL